MNNTATSETVTRVSWLDSSRGLAIILMVIFHLCYDLSTFHFVDFDFSGAFWRAFRTVIVVLFFGVSGWTMTLKHSQPIQWPRFLYRFGQVAGGALLISLVTFVMFPQQWVYFGILHFFALSMWVALPFRSRPYLALTVALIIFILDATQPWFHFTLLFNAVQPWLNLPDSTLDIARFTPWFGVVLLGIFLGHITSATPLNKCGWYHRLHDWMPQAPRISILAWAGKHPLALYLIHQPLLYGVTAATAAILL